jgi:hypothetical protein
MQSLLRSSDEAGNMSELGRPKDMPVAVAEAGRRGRAQRTMPHELKRLIRPG